MAIFFNMNIELNIKHIYLSGPMLGIPDNNFPEFFRITKILRDYGYVVFNPAEEYDGPMGWHYYIKKDVRVIMNIPLDAIVLINGWQTSKGVDVELYNAINVLEIPVFEYNDTNINFDKFTLTQIKNITWKREITYE